MNAITQALAQGMTEVKTAAGWFPIDVWAKRESETCYWSEYIANLTFDPSPHMPANRERDPEKDGTGRFLGPWRPLSTLEQMHAEAHPELQQPHEARDSWPVR